MEYADLAILDFSTIGTPEGRAELAVQLRDAMTTHGFFYIINHGLTQSEVRCSNAPLRYPGLPTYRRAARPDVRHR